MNRFWVRLSGAFIGIALLTAIFIFSLDFVLSWIPFEPANALEDYLYEYEILTAPYVEALIIEGKSDAEIMALLDNREELEWLLWDARDVGFAPGVDVEDRSFGRITTDYLSELINPLSILIALISSLFGIIASIIFSRQLVRPLARLTQASHALGESDLSQRVSVQGSDEINELAATFNRMAEQLEQNEIVRQNLLADISHELRTPLAGLEGTLRGTLDGVFEIENQHISNLYGQTRHLSRLVDDLHLLARAEARRLTLDKTATDLATLLYDLLELFRIIAEDANVTLREEITPIAEVEIDAGRIRQVVSNLLNNALRHTPPGGTITLSLHQSDATIFLKVQDTGEGIAAEHLPQLFDRFYRVDESRSRDSGGTGLGLAITKALVEAHGGVITAESDGKGCGASFIVQLFFE